MFLRSFSTSAINNGSVKSKLKLLLTTKDPKKALTKKEIAQKNQKIIKLKQQHRSKPLNPQKFKTIIKNENYQQEDITPEIALMLNSASDTSTGNLKLLYNYLGTSGFQLQDSYVIEKDVLKFLGKGHDMKAILLCKLAKSNGIVGMNRILQYYLDNSMYNNALKLVNWRKKWNVPMNEQSFTILFNGFGKSEKFLTENQLDKLYNIYMDITQKYRERRKVENQLIESDDEKKITILTRTHINSVLSCLTNSKNQEYAWKIFKNLALSGPHSADNITMTVMLNGLRNIDDEKVFIKRFRLLLNEAIQTKIDLGNKVDLMLLTSLVTSIATHCSSNNKESVATLADEKQKVYSLIFNYVDLKKYNFEDFQKIEIYNEKRKLLPNKKLLTSLVKLTSIMPNVNANDYFFRILEKNYKSMDNIFVKEWLIGSSKSNKVSNVGENTYESLRKLIDFLQKNNKDYLKVISNDNFSLVNFTFSCLASQSFHLNNQYFNSKRWKINEDNKDTFQMLKKKSNYKLLHISQQLKNMIPETTLINDINTYHSYLNSIHNLQLNLNDEIKIIFDSLKVINNYQVDNESREAISKKNLLALKGILLNIMKYSKSATSRFKFQLLSQTNHTYKDRESINLQLKSLKRFMSVLIEPVYSLDKLIKNSK